VWLRIIVAIGTLGEPPTEARHLTAACGLDLLDRCCDAFPPLRLVFHAEPPRISAAAFCNSEGVCTMDRD
jgi:hypothetical protein